jgi:hypothetical protein
MRHVNAGTSGRHAGDPLIRIQSGNVYIFLTGVERAHHILSRRLQPPLSGNDVRLSRSAGSCSLSAAGFIAKYRPSPFDQSLWRTVCALRGHPSPKKVRFVEDAWNGRNAGAGERRAAERDIRGFALELAEERNWDLVGKKPLRTVAGIHDELSARSLR